MTLGRALQFKHQLVGSVSIGLIHKVLHYITYVVASVDYYFCRWLCRLLFIFWCRRENVPKRENVNMHTSPVMVAASGIIKHQFCPTEF
jgi:hypothetical protein